MRDLELYEGCHVQLRNGETTGPLQREKNAHAKFPWSVGKHSWTPTGGYFLGEADPRDIVSVISTDPIVETSADQVTVGIREDVLAAAREAGLKARPAYDEFVAAIVEAAFAAQESSLPLMVLKNPEHTGKCMFTRIELQELLDPISTALTGGKQFDDHSPTAQEKIRNAATNVMRLIEGAQNESAPEIRPSEKTEGGQSDPLFRGLDKLHPATRAFLQAIYPDAPLRAVEAPSDFVLSANYGRPGKSAGQIRVTIEGNRLNDYPKIPLWIEEDGTYRPGSHPAAVEALIEGER